MIVAMLLVVPLVAVAPPVCHGGLRAGEIVPMSILVSCLGQEMWDPAAGIAERTALSSRDLVVLLTRAGFPRPAAVAESWNPARPRPVAVAENWNHAHPNCLPAAVNL